MKALPHIAQVVLSLPIEGPFDYSIPKDLRESMAVGKRVKMFFNKRRAVGFVVALKEKSAFDRLNSIIDVLDEGDPSVSEPMFKVLTQMKESCCCTLGEAISTYLPSALRKEKKVEIRLAEGESKERDKVQKIFIHDIGTYQFLDEMLPDIKKCLASKQSVILLVPEVFMVKRIESFLQDHNVSQIFANKKKVKASEEAEQWLKIRQSESSLVIGMRSSVFAPVNNLGLIVMIDEENESYKQEQSPHYHAREIVNIRVELERCDLMIVSRVPSTEVWQEVTKDKWSIKTLDDGLKNRMQVIDRANYDPKKSYILSPPLKNNVDQMLDQKKKTLLFFNRRSTTRVVPNKNGVMVDHTSMGVEKLTIQLGKLYPGAKISAFHKDSDSVDSSADIVIATQAITRLQRDLKFDLVGFVNFDAELMHYEFRTTERAFALLIYLRLMAREKFVVQTHILNDHALIAAKTMNFKKFYKDELKFRREIGLPPFKHIVCITSRGKEEQSVYDQSKVLFSRFQEVKPKSIEVSDPFSDLRQRFKDRMCYSLNLKGRSTPQMTKLTRKVLKGFKRKSGIIVTINVDP